MDLFSLMIGFLLGALAMTIVVKRKQKKAVEQMSSVGKRYPKEQVKKILFEDEFVDESEVDL